MFAGVLCLAMAGAATARAAEPNSAVLTPIHQFIGSFNKGDLATARATHAADASIQDEVPPHVWRGPGAFDAWAADLGKASKAAGMTDESVALGKPLRIEVDGDAAYVVAATAFNYRQHGRRMTEAARMVFSLHQEPAGWKISAWAWAGEAPHPAAAHRAGAAAPPAAPAAKP
ncbi:nuclear transport factor 2 family protein [Phenylobacterium sp.]|uniref:nuclear transport factor 2 family protein n=1 Tax=Phenylobacterium sp. TaxID=1871053 RepID=UPI002F3F96EA